jgi:hypothetical protein
MGKYLGIAIGAVVMLLGIKGLVCWWPDLLTVLKGSVPAIMILAGGIALVAGFSEIKDEFSPKK